MSNEITAEIVTIWHERNNDGEGFAVGSDHDADCASAAREEGWTILDSDCEGDVLARTKDGRIVYVGNAHGPWGCYVD